MNNSPQGKKPEGKQAGRVVGFITETIPGYGRPYEDWECIEDLCQQGTEPLNVCAWHHKPTNHTHFGGDWSDCPSVAGKMTEKQVWEHAGLYSCAMKHRAARARQQAAVMQGLRDTDNYFKVHGVNFVYVILSRDGQQTKIKQPIGRRTLLDILPTISYNIQHVTQYKGSRIVRLVVKNKPYKYADQWWGRQHQEFDI